MYFEIRWSRACNRALPYFSFFFFLFPTLFLLNSSRYVIWHVFIFTVCFWDENPFGRYIKIIIIINGLHIMQYAYVTRHEKYNIRYKAIWCAERQPTNVPPANVIFLRVRETDQKFSPTRNAQKRNPTNSYNNCARALG